MHKTTVHFYFVIVNSVDIDHKYLSKIISLMTTSKKIG